MEVQVLHKTVEGDYKFQAILSFLFKKSPGDVKKVFERFNLFDLPSMDDNVKKEDNPKGPIHPLMFLYDFENQWTNVQPFNYYKYMGSQTQPPCSENVVWLVVDEPIFISNTQLAMFKESLQTESDKKLHKESPGNNR